MLSLGGSMRLLELPAKLLPILLMIMALGFTLAAQEKTGENKKATLELQVKILQAQRDEAALNAEYTSCQVRIADDPKRYAELEQTIRTLMEQAFTDAKLKREDYELNMQTFEFQKKPPVPAGNAAKPTTSKPEEKKPQ
jgi:hypothetical protein